MECCGSVSIETVLQVVKFYTVVNWKKKFKKLTFRTVVLRWSKCDRYSFVNNNQICWMVLDNLVWLGSNFSPTLSLAWLKWLPRFSIKHSASCYSTWLQHVLWCLDTVWTLLSPIQFNMGKKKNVQNTLDNVGGCLTVWTSLKKRHQINLKFNTLTIRLYGWYNRKNK